MSEKRKPTLTFAGLAPGGCPTLEITIPLDGEQDELVERLLKLSDEHGPLFAPVAPLTTRVR